MEHAVVPALTLAFLAARVRDHQDQAAFTQLLDRHTRVLRNLLNSYRWADMYTDRDDLEQACLVGFWKACSEYEHNWQVTYTAYAIRNAQQEMSRLVRTARARKHMVVTTAESLEKERGELDGVPVTIGNTLPAPERWQPEVLAEIRADLAEAVTVHRQRQQPKMKRGRVACSDRAVPHPPATRKRVLALIRRGRSNADAAEKYGVPVQTVRMWARAAA